MRVIGNNAVYPGKIDLNDNQETVVALFGIVNYIFDEMITRPQEIKRIYSQLPGRTRRIVDTPKKGVITPSKE